MNKIFITILIPLLMATAHNLWATDYFVDATNGIDSNDGLSTSTAWRTIAKVNSSMGFFSPGDRILFRRGQTFSGNSSLNITCNGSIDNPITFGAYSTGNKPVFDAAGFDYGEGAIKSYACDYVTIDNIRVYNASNGNATGIVIRNTSGGMDHGITISNCDVETVPVSGGILLMNCDGYTIDGCTIANCREYGIAIYGSASNKITNGIIQNCEVYDCPKDGITLHRDGNDNHIGPNHYLFNNVVHDIIKEDGFDITSGTNIILRGNETYNCPSLTDFSVNWTASRVFIEDHYGHNGRMAISNENSSHVVVAKSVFYNYTRETLIFCTDDTSDVYFANNIIVVTSAANRSPARFLIYQNGEKPENLNAKNNIFTSTSSNDPDFLIAYENGITPGNSNSNFDFNRYWRPTAGQNDNLFLDSMLGPHNLAARRSTWGEDENSAVSDPNLSDPTNGDFTLQSDSPCINSGGWLTTITSTTGIGNQFTVEDAKWFHDGFGLTTGSLILLEGEYTPVRVTSVNYSTNTIRVHQDVSWAQGYGVAFAYKGNAPDVGANEYGSNYPLNAVINSSTSSGENPLDVSFTGNVGGELLLIDIDGISEMGRHHP